VTLAPELPGAIDFIERASSRGLIVAIGHTAAEPQEISDAIRAGARLSTHLGNGTHTLMRRHPNHLWEQLASDDLWASFIVDGHHLPPATLKCFLRCKTIARSVLITDAIAAAGLPPGRYRFNDLDVDLNESRRVSLSGTPYLAGSALEMHEAVGNLVRFAEVSLEESLAMAGSNPALLLECENAGRLEPGKRANLIVAHWHGQEQRLRIEATMIDGEIVFESDQVKGIHEQ
jgi:N-acetylglucosamine-6-phosphate deacetylase